MSILGHTGAIESTLSTNDTIRMTMDEDAAPLLMASISTNLYANPVRAVLREYVSNALDSHVRAGQTRPVEVTLPTSLTPTLKIQDWGVGLSETDIEQMFSKFGGSDKRDSSGNSIREGERGGFGLGSKSAFSLGPQFTYIATQGDIRLTVLVSLNSDYVPVMKIVSRQLTIAPDGVTILIPTNAATDFRDAASTLFLTTKPGTVLVDGKAPAGTNVYDSDAWTPVRDADGSHLGWWRTDTGAGYARAPRIDVLGVNYPAPGTYEGIPGLLNGRTVLAVNPADVRFSTSRDTLIPLPSSIKSIQRQYRAFRTALEAQYRAAVADAPTAADALRLARQAPDGAVTTWHGAEVPRDAVPLAATTYLVPAGSDNSGTTERLDPAAEYVHIHVGHDGLVDKFKRAALLLRRHTQDYRPHLLSTRALSEESPFVRALSITRTGDSLLDEAREISRRQRAEARNGSAPRTPTSATTVRLLGGRRGASTTIAVTELDHHRPYAWYRQGQPNGLDQNLPAYANGDALPTAYDLLIEAGYHVVRLARRQDPAILGEDAEPAADVLARLQREALALLDPADYQAARSTEYGRLQHRGIPAASITCDACRSGYETHLRIKDDGSGAPYAVTRLLSLGGGAADAYQRRAAAARSAHSFPLLGGFVSAPMTHRIGYVNAVCAGIIPA